MPEESREKLESALQHVKTDRRTFLRRLFIGGAGAAAAAAFVPLASEVSAHSWNQDRSSSWPHSSSDSKSKGKGKSKGDSKGLLD